MRTKPFLSKLTLTMGATTLASLCSVGCMNLKRASSGQIGCPADEIEISETSRAAGTETWTATCRGVTYYCSRISNGRYSNQYQCAREVPKEDETHSAAPSLPAASATPTPQPPQPAFPSEALGFTFGSTEEEASTACAAAGHTWEAVDDGFRCSGLGTDIGVPAYSKLKFCDSGLCQIQAIAVLEPDDAGEKNIKLIYEKLRAKYGKPAMNNLRYPADCKGHFLSCVLEDRASWKARWKWPDKQLVYIATSIQSGKPILAVLYRQRDPGSRDQIKSDAF